MQLAVRPHELVRTVAVAFHPGSKPMVWHKRISSLSLAERIARLRGFAFAGTHDPKLAYPGHFYLVPEQTLIGSGNEFGVKDDDDFFGGLVSHPVIATKAITHPLFEGSPVPDGWSESFPAVVREVVLEGWSAFDMASARAASLALLEAGPIRLKLAGEDGGHGQCVVSEAAALDEALEAMAEAIEAGGIVVERNLDQITTYSIGRLSVGDLHVAYCGTQGPTKNNEGGEAYGGSNLYVVKGGFDELMAAPVPEEVRRAASHARLYDAAADVHFAGFLASRRNYDVIAGRDEAGKEWCGVLEQSWRMGGATPAELVALEAFAADPELLAVQAACVEVYGPEPMVPDDAVISFTGEDPEVGHLTKFARIEARYHAF